MKPASGRKIPFFRNKDVNNPPKLVDRSVQIDPIARRL